MTITSRARRWGRLSEQDCRIEDFAALVSRSTNVDDYPHAAGVTDGVLVYDGHAVRRAIADARDRAELGAELVRALTDGPGVVLFEAAFPDHDVVDRVTAVFDEIIADERTTGRPAGDHFAAPGANSRVWNALQKLAVRDPDAFVDYYGNSLLAFVSDAWLGPGYQVTSQVNVVRPGGSAQEPHRDYHLGFMCNEDIARYPAHVHLLSPVLTLQGAVAHSDMPVESGPTMYLPYSQQYLPGYLAWRLPAFREYFAEAHVQPALRKGDAAFFNPALLHGAGANVTRDVQRTANLLQVSSAFGRAMEWVDRATVVRAVYPALLRRLADGADAGTLANAIAAAAEGYPFPTDLDLDQPVDGLTPPSQAAVVAKALGEGWDPARLDAALSEHAARRGGVQSR